MSDPLAPSLHGTPASVAFAPAEVTGDTACRKCAYNLRGLSTGGRCPECGTSVGFSIQGDYLRYCDPGWVDTLRKGVVMILSGIGVIVLAVVVGIALGASGRTSPGGQHPLSIILALAANVLMVVGAWLLTQPDPSGLGEDRYGTARKLIRITLVIGVFNQVFNLGVRMDALSPDVFLPILLLLVAMQLVSLVGQIAMLRYLSQLSLRIPDERLASRANLLMWGIGISYGLIVVTSGVVLLNVGTGGRVNAGMAAFGCIGGICGLALIIFGIMYLLMLDRLRRSLQEQAAIARSTWATGSAVAA